MKKKIFFMIFAFVYLVCLTLFLTYKYEDTTPTTNSHTAAEVVPMNN